MKSIEDIMAMAQNVQNELTKAQANLDTIEVEGASGGGLVKVTASAKGRIIGIAIDDSLIVPTEKQMLEDLIVAAFNRWPVLIPHDSGDVLEDLMDLHDQSMRNLRRGGLRGVMPKLVAARAEEPALAEVLDPLIERRYDPVRIILRRAIERRQLPRNTDIELGVHMIMDITASRLYFTPSDAGAPAIRERPRRG